MAMNHKIVIDFDEYIGAVKLNTQWRFFHDVLSMWILDYASYDPEYNPANPRFRGWRANLLVVDVNNAQEYCEAMTSRELLPEQIPYTFTEYGSQAPLTFVVNFDDRTFINGWQDNIAIDNYVPFGWNSMEDDPYKHIPGELRALWGK
jgi:hypothetical protein